MTNYVGPLDVPRTLDRLERRLGMDWIKSPYTRFEDVLAPDDPDLQSWVIGWSIFAMFCALP